MRPLLIAAGLSVACSSSAPSPDDPSAPVEPAAPKVDPLGAAVQARIDRLVVETGVPGISVAIVRGGGEPIAVVAGAADVERKTPLSPKDRMLLGSTGKTFVVAVILQLVAEGALDLDAPISTRIDEPWLARVPNGKSLTLRHLLAHRSGIPRHIFTREFITAVRADPDRAFKPAELVSFILDAEPLFAPGEGFAYSDTNYILAGIVLETVTGHTYYDELRRRVLEPLGLSDTEPSISRELVGLVPGYSELARLFGGAPTITVGDVEVMRVVTGGRYFVNPQFEWTGGGLISTPSDLARWAAALYGGTVLGEPQKRVMLAGQPSPTLGGHYGLGAHLIDDPHLGPGAGHEGVMPGYLTELRYFARDKIAIAVQMNTDARALLGHEPSWAFAQIAEAVAGALERR